jgi:hypothetical protein
LNNGFRFSKITGINEMNLRFPEENFINPNFKGLDQGLPNGDPELIIDPLSTKTWPWK